MFKDVFADTWNIGIKELGERVLQEVADEFSKPLFPLGFSYDPDMREYHLNQKTGQFTLDRLIFVHIGNRGETITIHSEDLKTFHISYDSDYLSRIRDTFYELHLEWNGYTDPSDGRDATKVTLGFSVFELPYSDLLTLDFASWINHCRDHIKLLRKLFLDLSSLQD
jgi:hypothetical protein